MANETTQSGTVDVAEMSDEAVLELAQQADALRNETGTAFGQEQEGKLTGEVPKEISPQEPAKQAEVKKDTKEPAKEQDAQATEQPKQEESYLDKLPQDLREKIEKEQRRFARNWQRLQDQQAFLKQQEEQLRQKQIEIEAKEKLPDPDEYEKLASKYEEEGDVELARKAKDYAKHLRDQIPVIQKRKYEAQQAAFTDRWRTNWDEQLDDNPELGDPKTELYAIAKQLYETNPTFRTTLEGPRHLVALAKDLKLAKSASQVAAENAALKAEIKKLKEATSVGGGGESMGKARPVHEMDDSALRAWIAEQENL